MIYSTSFYADLYSFFDIWIDLDSRIWYILIMNTLINTFEKKTRTAKSDLSSLHFHNGYEFIFVTNGSVLIEIDNITHNVKSPAIVLLNPFEQHKITDKSDDYERIILVFFESFLTSLT